jgi:hypothetical protein
VCQAQWPGRGGGWCCGGLALALFVRHVIFLPDVDLFDLVADEFRSSPSETYTDWRMSPLDILIGKAPVARALIINQHGFKRVRREASLSYRSHETCLSQDSQDIDRGGESHGGCDWSS